MGFWGLRVSGTLTFGLGFRVFGVWGLGFRVNPKLIRLNTLLLSTSSWEGNARSRVQFSAFVPASSALTQKKGMSSQQLRI